MSTLEAIFLGLFQGITEFLPISSSAHLQLLTNLFSIKADPSFFIFLHAATALSILTYYRKTLLTLKWSYAASLLIASLPLVAIAANKKFFLQFFHYPSIQTAGFIATALVLFLTDQLRASRQPLTTNTALIVGLSQMLAAIPGISRSGITIFSAKSCSLCAKEAVQFSLLLAVIASLGAFALELIEQTPAIRPSLPFCLSFVCSYTAGLCTIHLLVWLVEKKHLKWIGLYLLLLAAAALIQNSG